jgi:hypothetical protein
MPSRPSRRTARTTLQHTLQHLAIAAAAVLCVGARLAPERGTPGAVARAAATLAPSVSALRATAYLRAAAGAAPAGAAPATPAAVTGAHAAEVTTALAALARAVRPLSHPRALADAFQSYFAYRAAHPERGDKPYLYFVDYGLPSSTPRGYVFDMDARRVVEGPFTVAHGRGSSGGRDGVPRRFSNGFGSATTSLGLYVAQELYAFRGTTGGQHYRSTGLRLAGVSGAFNNRARARGVVAHGAPYVTAGGAGRSEGCPAMEPARAARLLPKLAHGGLVFLFAPDPRWMARDPWLAGAEG